MPPTAAEKTWETCLTHISDQISTQSFRTWFAPITPLSLQKNDDAAELRLAVPDAFHTEWLESHYAQVIRQAAADVVGRATAISYEVAPEQTKRESEPPSEQGPRDNGRLEQAQSPTHPIHAFPGETTAAPTRPPVTPRFDDTAAPGRSAPSSQA